VRRFRVLWLIYRPKKGRGQGLRSKIYLLNGNIYLVYKDKVCYSELMQESKLTKQEAIDVNCSTKDPLLFDDQAQLEKLEKVISEYIRPGIEEHGGVIELCGYRNGIAYVKMGGACEGCDSISATLEQGVEAILKLCVPEVEKVELIKEITEEKDKKICC